MFKFIGAIFILTATTFFSSKKIIEYYYTYYHLKEAIDKIVKINFERRYNLVYEKIYEKIGFNKDSFFIKAEKNHYINSEIKEKLKEFFNNLGKKTKKSEDEYIQYFLLELERDKNEAYNQFTENKKLYVLYGVSLGLFLIIVLI